MYEETFGTDWEDLDRRETLRRAYALGVAESLGSAPDGELDRLVSQFAARYDQSLVELAYDEGRTRGRTPAPDETVDEVWDDLVTGDSTHLNRPRGTAPPRPSDLPATLSTPEFLDRTEDALAQLNLPELLR